MLAYAPFPNSYLFFISLSTQVTRVPGGGQNSPPPASQFFGTDRRFPNVSAEITFAGNGLSQGRRYIGECWMFTFPFFCIIGDFPFRLNFLHTN